MQGGGCWVVEIFRRPAQGKGEGRLAFRGSHLHSWVEGQKICPIGTSARLTLEELEQVPSPANVPFPSAALSVPQVGAAQ